MRCLRVLVLAAVLPAAGCASVDYLLHVSGGHLDVLAARRPIETVIADPATSPALRARLARVREMRRFAAESLALPAAGSYHDYTDVGRDFVVWSVTAAPALSLQAHRWCYPVIGCLSYRGYFDLARANAEVERMRARGYDVYLAPVEAYSTLGWFDDPVLNTLMRGPEWYTASIIFHELTHARLYVPGDTAFNEAYAVAVQEEGERRWLARYGDEPARANHARYQRAQAAFLDAVNATRSQLLALYASARPNADKLAAKAAAFSALRARYAGMRAQWGDYRGYDRWFGQDLNNAKLALALTYNELAPRFTALIEQVGGDMEAFHGEVARIATLDKPARRAALPRAPG